MKQLILLDKFKKRVLAITIGLGIPLLATSFLVDIVRARIINIDNITRELEEQKEAHIDNPNFISKVVVQRGFDYDKGLDDKCISWSTNQVGSGWSQDSEDHDFFMDYYIPPNKKAIICTTPVLATALTANFDKPFLYEVSPTDYGFRVRVVIGLSEVRYLCNLLGNVNCANSILSKQVIVRYEP
ncbi:hypothetical protein [Iningainema tapete]|uniref:Uncharacterized protein n=1 Tax=Iningainema tapete BLCC-T55 TaxID=2748662 RepID=A0A8J7C0J7_9CYAN|nr:hypothetical protein [Iningainema tapete]MBD2778143.1 hypothetical protein [Iningainema tapete BLCC-T55]